MYIKDNYDFYDDHEAELAAIEAKLPICAKCGRRITSDYAYDLDGLVCQDCFDDFVESIRVDTDEVED